jgi:ParB-like chromosome segregation protein Spo0J
MEIESVAIAGLVLDPQNARKHSDANLRAIGASLREFGQRKPIVVTESNIVIAGNGTVQAALTLGWESINVVRVPADWSQDRIRAFAVADNRIAELSEWNVAELFDDLSALGVELLEATGFTLEDIDDYGALLEEQTAPVSSSSAKKDSSGIDSETHVKQDSTYAEFLERYAARATRNVVLEFPAAEYAWINEQFIDYRNRHGLESNSEAVAKMIAEANGVEIFGEV